MYENLSYEDILKRLLERVPDTLDKREGSIIYDALSPCALEIKMLYLAIDDAISDSFADTASREFLIRRAAERGLVPRAAECAELRAVCVPEGLDIPLGTRFSMGENYYFITEKLPGNSYRIKCETAGASGNAIFGVMTPVEYVKNLESFAAVEVLIPGVDEEDTEAFRERYFDSFDSHAVGGNVTDYIEKTTAIAGVGAVKVTPVWRGGGTVELTILDSEFNAASPELLARVQGLIDPEAAMGEGLAPIGHSVTVDTAEKIPINISMRLDFDDGFSFEILRDEIENVISDFLLEFRKSWSDRNSFSVRVSQIESRLMGVRGIIDISDTKICGAASNIELTRLQIPVLGVIECE